MYRLSRIYGELETTVKSVTKEADGELLIRLQQTGAIDYNSVAVFPEGAHDVTYRHQIQNVYSDVKITAENEAEYYDSGTLPGNELEMPKADYYKNKNRPYTETFKISEEALDADNTVECSIITPSGSRSLQFERTINYKFLSAAMPSAVSANEVLFQFPSQRTTGADDEVFRQNVANIHTYGGKNWDKIHISGVESTVAVLDPNGKNKNTGSSFEYAELVSGEKRPITGKNEDTPGYTVADYKRENRGMFEGAWLNFETVAPDFMVAIRVDGISLSLHFTPMMSISSGGVSSGTGASIYTHNNVHYVSSKSSSIIEAPTVYHEEPKTPGPGSYYPSGMTTTDDENGTLVWMTAKELESWGLYDADSGVGFLPLTMKEPDAYPHVYNVEVFLKYKDASEHDQIASYDDSVTIFADAAVLENWSYTHLNGSNSTTAEFISNVRSVADRKHAEALHNSDNQINLDWNGSTTFTFRAKFDKPEEISDVYAVAEVDEGCENWYFPMEYDEEKGLFIGTGLLGDELSPPEAFNVVYNLKANSFVDGLPAIDLADLVFNAEQDMVNEPVLPDGWTYKIVAPENGWTLPETEKKWKNYLAAITDDVLTEAEIHSFTDSNGRLYYPAAAINENGKYKHTANQYYEYAPEGATFSVSEQAVSLALLDKGNKVSEITLDATVNKNTGALQFTTLSTDSRYLLPYLPDGITAASGGVTTQGVPVGSIGRGIWKGVKEIGPNAVEGLGVADTINTINDNVERGNNSDWAKDLPAVAYHDYMQFERANELANGLEIVGGFVPGAIGTSITLGSIAFERMVGGKKDAIREAYKRLAEAERQRRQLEQNLSWLPFDPDWHPDRDPIELDPNEAGGSGGKKCYHIDPSGYVFEGIESNRLEGVTATVLERVGNEWKLWNSEAYNEGPNPNITDKNGVYGWNVLPGKWKVIFEKNGYYFAESEELNVPPAHADVNISLLSYEAAALGKVTAGPEYVDFTFTKPVTPESVQQLVTVDFNGAPIAGSIAALDAAETVFGNKQQTSENDVQTGVTAATAFRFTPDDAGDLQPGEAIQIVGKAGVITYNGVEMAAFASEFTVIPAALPDLIRNLGYSGEQTLAQGESLDPADGVTFEGAEGDVAYTLVTPALAELNGSVLTAKSEGRAVVVVSANGESYGITITIAAPTPAPLVAGHDLAKIDAKAATCEEDGNIAYYRCAGCGKCFSDEAGENEIDEATTVLPASGHAWGDWTIVTTATEEAAGEEQRVCANDETHVETRTLDKLPHTLELVSAKRATCEENGNIAYYRCTGCGKCFSDEAGENEIDEATTVLPADGHAWGDWTVVTPATEEAAGEEQRVCANDETHVETRVIPQLDHVHTLQAVQGSAATCLAAGEKDHWVCTGCERFFLDAAGETEVTSDQLVIPALGHDFARTFSTDRDPTCTEKGEKSRHCTRCDARTDITAIPANGHSWGAWVQTKAPTCAEFGEQERICTVCDAKDTAQLEKLPHQDADGDNVCDECSADLTPADVCPICGKTEHDSYRSQVLHGVLVFLRELVLKVLLPLTRLLMGV